jgi:hypothetical protein
VTPITKFRLPVALLLAALPAALSVPGVAYGSIHRVTLHGDDATVTANGCRVTKNADHSITFACPAGHWAKLTWNVIGQTQPRAAVDCQPQACFHLPAVREVGRLHANDNIYRVTELIHHNRLVSMTATFGGLSPLAGLSRLLGSLNVSNDETS